MMHFEFLIFLKLYIISNRRVHSQVALIIEECRRLPYGSKPDYDKFEALLIRMRDKPATACTQQVARSKRSARTVDVIESKESARKRNSTSAESITHCAASPHSNNSAHPPCVPPPSATPRRSSTRLSLLSQVSTESITPVSASATVHTKRTRTLKAKSAGPQSATSPAFEDRNLRVTRSGRGVLSGPFSNHFAPNKRSAASSSTSASVDASTSQDIVSLEVTAGVHAGKVYPITEAKSPTTSTTRSATIHYRRHTYKQKSIGTANDADISLFGDNNVSEK